jgi:uncharacterized protein YlxW (UPF0749 family)
VTDYDGEDRRHAAVFDLSSWLRFALGGLVAGLVAYAGIAGRMVSMEVRLQEADGRASEDRTLLRETVQQLNTEIRELSTELAAEREERIRDEAAHEPRGRATVPSPRFVPSPDIK